MKRVIAAIAGLLTVASGAFAAPITYDLNITFPASTYYCVGCGGSESPPQTPGGTVNGTVTFDSSLSGADRLVSFDFSTFLPQQDPLSSYAPAQEFNFDYKSSDADVSVAAVGDTFTFHDVTQLFDPAPSNPPVNFKYGWNAFFRLTLDGPLGGSTLDATLSETVHYQSNAGFDLFSYRWIPRNDRRARNGDIAVTLTSANVPAVPLPAAGFLMIGALGGLSLIRSRKKA